MCPSATLPIVHPSTAVPSRSTPGIPSRIPVSYCLSHLPRHEEPPCIEAPESCVATPSSLPLTDLSLRSRHVVFLLLKRLFSRRWWSLPRENTVERNHTEDEAYRWDDVIICGIVTVVRCLLSRFSIWSEMTTTVGSRR
jgi:hypothetical protein